METFWILFFLTSGHTELQEKEVSDPWLKFCLKGILLRDKDQSPTDQDLKQLLKDGQFLRAVKRMVYSCLSLVYDHGGFMSLDEVSTSRGPSLIAAVFSGSLHWTLATEWLMTESPDLYNFVILPAFRCAVKLGMDQVN